MKAKLIVLRDPSTRPNLALGSGGVIKSDDVRDWDEVSCASCRWAEAAENLPRGFESHTLVCSVPDGGLAVDCAGPAESYVKPEHGCIDWEGK